MYLDTSIGNNEVIMKTISFMGLVSLGALMVVGCATENGEFDEQVEQANAAQVEQGLTKSAAGYCTVNINTKEQKCYSSNNATSPVSISQISSALRAQGVTTSSTVELGYFWEDWHEEGWYLILLGEPCNGTARTWDLTGGAWDNRISSFRMLGSCRAVLIDQKGIRHSYPFSGSATSSYSLVDVQFNDVTSIINVL